MVSWPPLYDVNIAGDAVAAERDRAASHVASRADCAVLRLCRGEHDVIHIHGADARGKYCGVRRQTMLDEKNK